MSNLATSSKKIKKSSSSSRKQHSKEKSPGQPSSNVKKSSHFPRVFTEEDELKILEAVLEIQEDKPVPAKAAVVIFNGIRDKITAQVNINRLGGKLRKLRDKYSKELDEKWNPHQKKLFILCNKIWGTKKNPVKQKILKEDDMRNAKEGDFEKNYPCLMQEVSKESNSLVSKDTLRYFDGSVLQQLDGRWRKQHFMELQNFLKRLDLIEEHVKLVLDAHTSSSMGKDDVDDEQAVAVDDESVGDDDDENEQSEDVDDEEAEFEVEVGADDE